MTEPNRRDIARLDDDQLARLQSLVGDELRGRAYRMIEPTRWTVGKLRSDLDKLPDDMPLLVNVSVESPGDPNPGFIPLVVTGGGFGVLPPNAAGDESILPIYNIETEAVDPADGRLIWIIASA
jgi:Family of unknown function (DUF6225)